MLSSVIKIQFACSAEAIRACFKRLCIVLPFIVCYCALAVLPAPDSVALDARERPGIDLELRREEQERAREDGQSREEDHTRVCALAHFEQRAGGWCAYGSSACFISFNADTE